MPIPTLSEIMRRSFIGGVAAAARYKIPEWSERPAAMLAVRFVAAYRLILSPWLGQRCLFRPSCSERAIAHLQQLGWTQAIQEVHGQLNRCCGNFVLRQTREGRLELETFDGNVFGEEELSLFVTLTYGGELSCHAESLHPLQPLNEFRGTYNP